MSDKVIRSKPVSLKSAYFFLNDKNAVQTSTFSAIDSYRGHSVIAARDDYRDFESNTSVRTQMGRSHYEYFRSGESLPKAKKDIIRVCMEAYRNVGLIKNIIDLMADFGSQGVKLIHANPQIQKFYRGWFKKIKGPERVERFLNLLYRSGNVIVQRSNGKVNIKEQKIFKTIGEKTTLIDDEIRPSEVNTTKKLMPLKYTFLNPLIIEVLGEDLSLLSAEPIYTIKVTNKLKNMISAPKNEIEKLLLSKLPKELVERVRAGDTLIPLDAGRVSCFFYKKDDWDTWADPMINAIIDDIVLLEKMKLADLAALDGAISQIRLWKLGDLEKGIFPTDTAVSKLSEILLSNPGGGAFDIIWGPDLKLESTKTDVHMFLGGAKYEPVLNSIYAGLGVPPTLTGAATASGFTNNYISLKTLIQRLEYGRAVVKDWLETEIELVRQAMGFKRGAAVVFDNMILSDEASEKKLLIELVDRDLLPAETVLEVFGHIPEIEKIKLKKEHKARKSGQISDKAGPYHQSEKYHDLLKIALQRGFITPKQSGLNLPEPDGEVPFDKQMSAKPNNDSFPATKNSGGTGGRPLLSKDKNKRKSKVVKPVGASYGNVEEFINSILWAKETQAKIADIITPGVLNTYGKKNLRQLSEKEYRILDDIKFRVLSNLSMGSNINDENVKIILDTGAKLNAKISYIYNHFLSDFIQLNNRQPTTDELHVLQASAYSVYSMEESYE